MDRQKSETKWILWGIPILFLTGSIAHFLYPLSNQQPFIGLWAPKNESVFEHTKLWVWPMILWWQCFLIFDKISKEEKKRWLQAQGTALPVGIIGIPFLYYFIAYGLGIQKVWLDIVSFLVVIIISQSIGLHVFRRGRGISLWISRLWILIIGIGYIYLTVRPPALPVFISP